MKFNTDFAKILALTTKHDLKKELAALIAQKTWSDDKTLSLWMDVYSREIGIAMTEAEVPEDKDAAREELLRLFVQLRHDLCDILPASGTEKAAYQILYPHRVSETGEFNLLSL